jgi:hypothetical protein
MLRNTMARVLALVCLAAPAAGAHDPECSSDGAAEADENAGSNAAIEWNGISIDTLVVTSTANAVSPRLGAIVHTAMFDAWNGVRQEYTPLFYLQQAQPGTSARAALIAAAHTTLVALFPSRQLELDTAYSTSLASAGADSLGRERGIDYGTAVAQAVLAWRVADGFANEVPPFTGGTALGQWRPTPPALAPMSAAALAFTQPFVLESSSQFRPPRPRDLLSQSYTDDVATVTALGRRTDSARSEQQTALALFWDGNASVHWNQAANQAATQHQLSDSQSARLFALLNSSMADTAITTWSAKRFYAEDPSAVTWRPVTAIPLASADGNPETAADEAWLPLITTPAHPEYPAGHPSLNGAAATVLGRVFDDDAQSFTLTTPNLPERTYTSLMQARADADNARVWGGLHYPSTVAVSDAEGAAIAEYIDCHAMLPRPARWQ